MATQIALYVRQEATSAFSSILATPTSSPLPQVPGEVGEGCRLLGPFALLVQGIMGLMVMGSLVYKRRREKPQRPWKIWILDVSKQVMGQAFVHSLNVLLSNWGSHQGDDFENPCTLYALNIAVDTTIGVVFIYGIMRFLTHVLTDVLGVEGCVSGQYTSATIVSTVPPPPPRTSRRPRLPRTRTRRRYSRNATQHAQRPRIAFWARQLGVYLFALLLMKIAVIALFDLLPFIVDVGHALLDLFGTHKNAQVVFVMAILPLVLNTLQFWLIDSLLRHDPLTSVYADGNDESGAHPGPDGRFSTSSEYLDESEADLEQGRGRRSSSLYDAGRNQSEAHLVGDASDSEDEDGRRRRSSASARAPAPPGNAAPVAAADSHAYPPPVSRPTSRTTSPRQVDASDKATSAAADYGAFLGSPPLSPTHQPSIEAMRVKAGTAFNEAPADESDAWDAWDDGEDATPADMPPNTNMGASTGSLKGAAAATRKREGSSDSLRMSPTVTANRKLRVD